MRYWGGCGACCVQIQGSWGPPGVGWEAEIWSSRGPGMGTVRRSVEFGGRARPPVLENLLSRAFEWVRVRIETRGRPRAVSQLENMGGKRKGAWITGGAQGLGWRGSITL